MIKPSLVARQLCNFAVYASAIAFSLAAPTQAAEQTATSQVKPDPQLDQLQYFQGKWICAVKEAGAPASKPADTFTWTVRRVLNNFWFLGQVEDNQNVALTQDTLGYNTLTKRFGRTVLTSDGQFLNFLSNGWTGKTWIWEGSVVRGDQKETLRETIVKKSDREFEATYEKLAPVKQEWQPLLKEICRKLS